jgi:hypothetical protein
MLSAIKDPKENELRRTIVRAVSQLWRILARSNTKSNTCKACWSSYLPEHDPNGLDLGCHLTRVGELRLRFGAARLLQRATTRRVRWKRLACGAKGCCDGTSCTPISHPNRGTRCYMQSRNRLRSTARSQTDARKRRAPACSCRSTRAIGLHTRAKPIREGAELSPATSADKVGTSSYRQNAETSR